MCSSTLGTLCRVDEGKKGLASWEVSHMLEEGVCGRALQDGGTWSCLISRGGMVGLITSRHGMGTPGGAHAGRWWPEMARITDCSAGLGCFEEGVGTSKTDSYLRC